MEKNEKTQNKFVTWLKESLTVRMFVVGTLSLLLLIPLAFISNLIEERWDRKNDVIGEISEKWGEEVLIYGPVLKIPYVTYNKVYKENPETKQKYFVKESKVNYLYIFPEKYDVNGKLTPDVKYRGMYNTVVYNGKIKIDGAFAPIDYSMLDVDNKENIMFDKSKIIFQISNLKGIKNNVEITLNKDNYKFISKYQEPVDNYDYNYGNSWGRNSSLDDMIETVKTVDMHNLETGVLKIRDIADSSSVTFNLDLDINGSQKFRIIPIGKQTTLNLKSDWSNPSFIGNYLPYNKDKQTDTSFDAKWKVIDLNRGFSQYFYGLLPDLQKYSFGVNLVVPANQYQQSMRTSKYGFLVISLTFLVFVLFQSISKINIHPFQYLLIGLALTMFYTLLISISEHGGFLLAYLISSISVIALISWYSYSILKHIKFVLMIFLSLTTLYTFIYVIIQLENYALIVGSVGLFLILAAIMVASRKIDWKSL